jgi:hypothetical protein
MIRALLHPRRAAFLTALLACLAPVACTAAEAPLGRLAAGPFWHLAVNGGLALAAGESTIHVLDVSDPRRPREVARLETPETVGALALAGGRGWAELGIRFKKLETEAASVDQEWLRRGWLRMGKDSWSQGAFVGVSNVVALDLADPARPRVAGGIDLTPPDTLAMRSPRLLLAGGRLYVNDDPMGLHVLDVAEPNRPRRLGGVERGLRFALAAPRLYVADGAGVTITDNAGSRTFPGGFAVVDLSDPAAPREVGRIDSLALGSRGDGANVDVVAANGRYAYLGLSILRRNLAVEEYLAVVDVADPARPRVVERRRVRDGVAELLIEGTTLYALDTSDRDTVTVYDLADPAQPREVRRIRLPLGGDGVALALAVDRGAIFAAGWEDLVIVDAGR